MEILHIVVASLGSLIALFFLTRIMGNRQVSQLSTFDYINGITIGSIAAEFATSLENDFVKPLVAMIVYALATLAIAYFTCKSIRMRRFFNGRPLILYKHGKLYAHNLLRAKLDLNEFLGECRIGGWFDLSELESVVLETNGKMSFLPMAGAHPLTGDDLGIKLPTRQLCINVVIDGKIMPENLKDSGRDEKWLSAQLHALGMPKLENVFLASIDTQGRLEAFARNDDHLQHNCFE